MRNKPSAILLISCPDQVGIDAAVTSYVSGHRGNIIDFDQHVDAQKNVFFMRIEWELEQFTIDRRAIAESFRPLADQFDMRWHLSFNDVKQRMAVFVSKQSHCLYDMLARYESGEWSVELPLIVSNHPDLEQVASTFGIDFYLYPKTKENKMAQERAERALLQQYRVDFIVLARYMQILSDEFVSHYPNRIINIHHSFLPAFAGGKPYHAAFGRGVKLIGATSHYVTAALDGGPIIDQDTRRVTHKDAVEDLVHKGRDLEKIVLARAIWWHLQHKILVYNNKTVIFE